MWEFSISAPQAKKLSVFDLKIKEIGGLGFGFRGSGGAPVPRHLAELGNFSKDFGKSTPGPIDDALYRPHRMLFVSNVAA